jgi:hypothetical protein
MVVRWNGPTSNLSCANLTFLDKIKKNILSQDSDVSFSFSNVVTFLIVAFTCMSEGISIMFAHIVIMDLNYVHACVCERCF